MELPSAVNGPVAESTEAGEAEGSRRDWMGEMIADEDCGCKGMRSVWDRSRCFRVVSRLTYAHVTLDAIALVPRGEAGGCGKGIGMTGEFRDCGGGGSARCGNRV